jgi:hypothetical protein
VYRLDSSKLEEPATAQTAPAPWQTPPERWLHEGKYQQEKLSLRIPAPLPFRVSKLKESNMALTLDEKGRLAWPPPEGCPSWCTFSETHKISDHPEDRNHYGQDHEVRLSLHDPVECQLIGDDRWWEPEVLKVSLKQHGDAADPQIEFSLGDGAVLIKLAFHEVIEMVNAIWTAVHETKEA